MTIAPSKTVAGRSYVHVSCLDRLSAEVRERIEVAARTIGVVPESGFNVVRIEPDTGRFAFLNYPGFFDEPFPSLRESWLVDSTSGEMSYRTYAESLNPPILHRKERLLPEGHERRAEYLTLTEAAESIGLFDDPTRIGFRKQWLELIRSKGYTLSGHALLPIGNDESNDGEHVDAGTLPAVARHLTALKRYGFSAPVQTLARYGFLDGRYTVFDYGCGRGDDIRGLRENGIDVGGWDPHFAPDQPIRSANIVNLGFVINVIENLNERIEALRKAYALCEQVLVVAAMLANQNAIDGQRFSDGVLTRRGTFQKYYSQSELKEFIEVVLGEEPIAVGPGIFYLFHDKDAEQRFLAERYRSRRNVLRLPTQPVVKRAPRERPNRAAEKYDRYREVLESLWAKWLDLGREPDKGDVPDLLALTEGFGSLGKALRFISSRKNVAEIDAARAARAADLTVYFALNQFEKRRPYKHLDPTLQRDIRTFFGDYTTAQQVARDLLFQIAKPTAIDAACKEASERGLGYLVEGASLQLHASLVERLPPLLRVYVGCAAALYGDYRSADLIKIHIRSGKLTLMRYDDFEGQPLPRMIERVKILLRRQDFEYYSYGEEYEPPFLYFKSRYINEEFPHYPDQVAFDEALTQFPSLDLSAYGPRPGDLFDCLKRHRWTIDGYSLVRARAIPGLDDPCGRYFKFRDLIECGETQEHIGIPNLPKEPESYNALYDLGVNVLDPVIDYFGMIKLTYGFCSPELGKHIKRHVAAGLDQHAAHEKKRSGKLVCDRLGAAVDFMVEDEDMSEVADWIIENVNFDRLYFYGPDRPIHVSFSPHPLREAVHMRILDNGSRIPVHFK